MAGRERDASTPAAAARCRRAAGPGGRSRTTRASRAAARRCWPRAGTRGVGAERRASVAQRRARSASRCSSNSGDLGIVGGREVRVDRVDLEVGLASTSGSVRRGCRAGTRAGSCRCRSSGGSASRAVRARRPPAARAPRRASRWSASGRASNRPSRSLTLSAPKTRIGARDAGLRAARRPPRCRRTRASSAPASSSASATCARAVAVGVGLDDGDDRRRGRPVRPASPSDEARDRLRAIVRHCESRRGSTCATVGSDADPSRQP